MNYKISGAMRKSRKHFIIYAIIWVLIAILLCPALTYSYAILTRVESTNVFQIALSQFSKTIINPIAGFNEVFSRGIVGEYFGTLLGATIIYTVFFLIGIAKAAPKNEYTDIEHGSSDWSQHGEQYRMLSKNKGIVLAQDNYLPVDRRGNLNVLVVGRIWFW